MEVSLWVFINWVVILSVDRAQMGKDMSFKSRRLAVLIDAENASADGIETLLKKVTQYGTAHVKRVYGDWTNGQLVSWKAKLNKLAIQPIQQFRYTTGKNSSDSALIIDAMDLLYTRNFDGFCIVSSDSDFTRLASRIRESGLVVYGFGEPKTPEAFVSACDEFIYTDKSKPLESSTSDLSTGNKQRSKDAQKASVPSPFDSIAPSSGTKQNSKDAQKASKAPASTSTNTSQQSLKIDKKLLKLLKDAYAAIVENDGWTRLGTLGAQIKKLSPSFNPKNYGHNQLWKLLKATNIFDFKETHNSKDPKIKEMYIKQRLEASTQCL